MLAAYREHPDDFYLLRVGYGGAMSSLTNVDQDGFASAAFHSFPDMLKFAPYSADYGPNFFGHAVITATYLVRHAEFGWLGFGGNVTVSGDVVTVAPRHSFRNRIYIAPVGLWLTLESGTLEKVEFNSKTRQIRIALTQADRFTPAARLRLEQPAKIAGVSPFVPTEQIPMERGAYTIPLDKATKWFALRESKQ